MHASSYLAPRLIVVPTFDEAGNVPRLVEHLDALVATFPFDVLVVDDESPDGTGDLVQELSETRPWLFLLRRERPMGLGSAYRDGFRWGLERDYDVIGEMDADLSHDPLALPQLITLVESGANLAIGSRYVPEGRSEGWPLSRRLLSRGANRFARTLLRLRARDVTAGFRVYDRAAIRLLLEAGTRCDGYGFQVEGAYLVTRAGGRLVEAPIVFVDRTLGRSKMSGRVAVEAARRCLALAIRPPKIPALAAEDPEPMVAATGTEDA